mgnify:CR=1 FL=1
MLKEVLEIFDPKPGQIYIDATVNGGGHAIALAQRLGQRGKIIGIDWDCALVEELRTNVLTSGVRNAEAICDNYVNIARIAESKKMMRKVHGVLFDLGFSSHHIEYSGRGFSFLRDEPLDMRYNAASPLTAEEIVNTWTQGALEKMLAEFGEERFAARIARAIVRSRENGRIRRTLELVRIIEGGIPRGRRERIHPATKTFQAFRIAVNNELGNLGVALRAAVNVLVPGGKIAVISFHSLEDRIVKTFIKEGQAQGKLRALTEKPIRAGREEIKMNPRARSAKLRAAVTGASIGEAI